MTDAVPSASATSERPANEYAPPGVRLVNGSVKPVTGTPRFGRSATSRLVPSVLRAFVTSTCGHGTSPKSGPVGAV